MVARLSQQFRRGGKGVRTLPVRARHGKPAHLARENGLNARAESWHSTRDEGRRTKCDQQHQDQPHRADAQLPRFHWRYSFRPRRYNRVRQVAAALQTGWPRIEWAVSNWPAGQPAGRKAAASYRTTMMTPTVQTSLLIDPAGARASGTWHPTPGASLLSSGTGSETPHRLVVDRPSGIRRRSGCYPVARVIPDVSAVSDNEYFSAKVLPTAKSTVAWAIRNGQKQCIASYECPTY